jgi:hypothetical protein
MNVLIDLNIALDVILQRQPWIAREADRGRGESVSGAENGNWFVKAERLSIISSPSATAARSAQTPG